MRIRTPLLIVIAIAMAHSSLAAQRRRGIEEVRGTDRGGFWGTFALGAGNESLNLDNDGLGYSDELTRPTVTLRLGGTVSPHFRLGGEVQSWLNDRRDTFETLTSFMLIGQVYPAKSSGFYLKAGAGLGRSYVDLKNGFGYSDDYGFAAGLGFGYDIPLSRKVALTPVIDVVGYRFGDAGVDGEGYRERVVHLGVGITFQTGR